VVACSSARSGQPVLGGDPVGQVDDVDVEVVALGGLPGEPGGDDGAEAAGAGAGDDHGKAQGAHAGNAGS
jgi:hypothetical protein